MVKTSHNKTIRINAAGDYQINSDNEIIVIDTTGNVKIHFPHMLKDNDRVNIIAVVAAPDVACKDGAGSEFANLTTDFGYMQVEYNTSADTYVFRELVAAGGAGGDTGWTLTPGVASVLASDLGIATDSIGTIASNVDYLSVIDTSVSDVTTDITSLDNTGNLIKQIKVSGPYDLILQSTAGFSDGTNELVVVDSCILFYDMVAAKWQILYNNEWKTKTVDITSAEILAIGTTPVELLPAPGVGKFYDIESIITKYTHDTTVYTTFADLAYLIGLNYYNTITGMITIASNSVNKALDSTAAGVPLNQALTITTNDSSDPTLGDGTLKVIIKYRVLTF